MKTKIDISELLKNEYFDFGDMSYIECSIDGKKVNIEKLKSGVQVENEFSVFTEYGTMIPFDKEYVGEGKAYLFSFNIILRKMQCGTQFHWVYDGILDIFDCEVEYKEEEIEDFNQDFYSYAEDENIEELESCIWYTHGLGAIADEHLFKLCSTAFYDNFEKAIALFNHHLIDFMGAVYDKFHIARGFIETLEDK